MDENPPDDNSNPMAPDRSSSKRKGKAKQVEPAGESQLDSSSGDSDSNERGQKRAKREGDERWDKILGNLKPSKTSSGSRDHPQDRNLDEPSLRSGTSRDYYNAIVRLFAGMNITGFEFALSFFGSSGPPEDGLPYNDLSIADEFPVPLSVLLEIQYLLIYAATVVLDRRLSSLGRYTTSRRAYRTHAAAINYMPAFIQWADSRGLDASAALFGERINSISGLRQTHGIGLRDRSIPSDSGDGAHLDTDPTWAELPLGEETGEAVAEWCILVLSFLPETPLFDYLNTRQTQFGLFSTWLSRDFLRRGAMTLLTLLSIRGTGEQMFANLFHHIQHPERALNHQSIIADLASQMVILVNREHSDWLEDGYMNAFILGLQMEFIEDFETRILLNRIPRDTIPILLQVVQGTHDFFNHIRISGHPLTRNLFVPMLLPGSSEYILTSAGQLDAITGDYNFMDLFEGNAESSGTSTDVSNHASTSTSTPHPSSSYDPIPHVATPRPSPPLESIDNIPTDSTSLGDLTVDTDFTLAFALLFDANVEFTVQATLAEITLLAASNDSDPSALHHSMVSSTSGDTSWPSQSSPAPIPSSSREEAALGPTGLHSSDPTMYASFEPSQFPETLEATIVESTPVVPDAGQDYTATARELPFAIADSGAAESTHDARGLAIQDPPIGASTHELQSLTNAEDQSTRTDTRSSSSTPVASSYSAAAQASSSQNTPVHSGEFAHLDDSDADISGDDQDLPGVRARGRPQGSLGIRKKRSAIVTQRHRYPRN